MQRFMAEISNGGVEVHTASPCFAASPMRDGCGAHTANLLTLNALSIVSESLYEKKSINYSWENI